ncbi:hypothetical protein [Candidatus Palauibacter sp.]|uniref:hypothetical protein n=1 Tax=Candidatus Palauibacter sp. TaxID=3101350 RepID=UPI003B012A9C
MSRCAVAGGCNAPPGPSNNLCPKHERRDREMRVHAATPGLCRHGGHSYSPTIWIPPCPEPAGSGGLCSEHAAAIGEAMLGGPAKPTGAFAGIDRAAIVAGLVAKGAEVR